MPRDADSIGERHNETARIAFLRCRRGRSRRCDPRGRLEPPEKTAAAPLPRRRDRRRAGRGQGSELGAIVGEADLRWENWPKDHIRKPRPQSASPSGDKELNGAIVRSNFAAASLAARAPGHGSAFRVSCRRLAIGSRAVAINIDAQGSSTAGGFILPNDRVDVIHIFMTRTPRARHQHSFVSQII